MLITLIEDSVFKKEKHILTCLPAQFKCRAEKSEEAKHLLTLYLRLYQESITLQNVMESSCDYVHLKISILRADINTFSYSLTHCPVYHIHSQQTEKH